MFLRRNLPADQLRQQQILNLSGAPQNILGPNLSGELPCETLSLESMTKWILCKPIFLLLFVFQEIEVLYFLFEVKMKFLKYCL